MASGGRKVRGEVVPARTAPGVALFSSAGWPTCLHDGAKAAPEFQRILDHQGVGANSEQYFLAHLNLGRAYVVARHRQGEWRAILSAVFVGLSRRINTIWSFT